MDNRRTVAMVIIVLPKSERNGSFETNGDGSSTVPAERLRGRLMLLPLLDSVLITSTTTTITTAEAAAAAATMAAAVAAAAASANS